MIDTTLTPFVKWAGGKTQLLLEIIKRVPKKFNYYYEPFIGGGSVLLALQPLGATINDINKELIHVYNTIKHQPLKLVQAVYKLDSYECDCNYYLKQKDYYNKLITEQQYNIDMAALFIFLNKHCFNGLYRVNKQGLFNVPWNKKTSGVSINIENILNISNYLQNIEIFNKDFEEVLEDCDEDDFIFIDSPYDPICENGFIDYSKEGFTKEDHIRLAKVFKKLDERGCYCMLTNHNTSLINELYYDFNIDIVVVRRSINSNGNDRKGKEVIITNY